MSDPIYSIKDVKFDNNGNVSFDFYLNSIPDSNTSWNQIKFGGLNVFHLNEESFTLNPDLEGQVELITQYRWNPREEFVEGPYVYNTTVRGFWNSEESAFSSTNFTGKIFSYDGSVEVFGKHNDDGTPGWTAWDILTKGKNSFFYEEPTDYNQQTSLISKGLGPIQIYGADFTSTYSDSGFYIDGRVRPGVEITGDYISSYYSSSPPVPKNYVVGDFESPLYLTNFSHDQTAGTLSFDIILKYLPEIYGDSANEEWYLTDRSLDLYNEIHFYSRPFDDRHEHMYYETYTPTIDTTGTDSPFKSIILSENGFTLYTAEDDTNNFRDGLKTDYTGNLGTVTIDVDYFHNSWDTSADITIDADWFFNNYYTSYYSGNIPYGAEFQILDPAWGNLYSPRLDWYADSSVITDVGDFSQYNQGFYTTQINSDLLIDATFDSESGNTTFYLYNRSDSLTYDTGLIKSIHIDLSRSGYTATKVADGSDLNGYISSVNWGLALDFATDDPSLMENLDLAPKQRIELGTFNLSMNSQTGMEITDPSKMNANISIIDDSNNNKEETIYLHSYNNGWISDISYANPIYNANDETVTFDVFVLENIPDLLGFKFVHSNEADSYIAFNDEFVNFQIDSQLNLTSNLIVDNNEILVSFDNPHNGVSKLGTLSINTSAFDWSRDGDHTSFSPGDISYNDFNTYSLTQNEYTLDLRYSESSGLSLFILGPDGDFPIDNLIAGVDNWDTLKIIDNAFIPAAGITVNGYSPAPAGPPTVDDTYDGFSLTVDNLTLSGGEALIGNYSNTVDTQTTSYSSLYLDYGSGNDYDTSQVYNNLISPHNEQIVDMQSAGFYSPEFVEFWKGSILRDNSDFTFGESQAFAPPTYTYIGGPTWSSTIDTSQTSYPTESTAVKFNQIIPDSDISLNSYASAGGSSVFDIYLNNLPTGHTYKEIILNGTFDTAGSEDSDFSALFGIASGITGAVVSTTASQITITLASESSYTGRLSTFAGPPTFFGGDSDPNSLTSGSFQISSAAIYDTNNSLIHEVSTVSASNSVPITGNSSLVVDTSTLYTDQGKDGDETNDMGVFLDIGQGMSSTLLPGENTVTAPKASEIYSGGNLINTLDGTPTDHELEALPWSVKLSDRTDILYGRDAVAETNSETGYAISVEEIIATDGDDQVDGGGGYNLANFSSLINSGNSSGVNFNMQSGKADWYSNNSVSDQDWFGFQSAIGTTVSVGDDIFGTGEMDNTVPEKMFEIRLGDKTIQHGDGSNVIIGNGGSDLLIGNGGEDILYLNQQTAGSFSTEAHGGEGADLIAFGLGADDVFGGGVNDVHQSSDIISVADTNDDFNVSSNYLQSDDFYNGIGHDFAFLGFSELPSAQMLKSVSSIQIGGLPLIDIDTSSISDNEVQTESLYEKFTDAVNAALNAHLNNTTTLWEYMSVSHDENNLVDGFALKFAQGLNSPVGASSYAYSQEQLDSENISIPTWSPALLSASGSSIFNTNMYSVKDEFVEGTGDDNDVFVAFAFDQKIDDTSEINKGIEVLDGDVINDFDIGQNSLSLRDEKGEAIYLDADFAGVQKITLQGKDADGNLITSDSIEAVTYDAVITLNDATPNDTSDDMSFTLKDINGPTASLIGDNEYKLVAVTKDVTYTNSGSDVGVDNTYSETKTVKELTFEWQAKGEKVGSDESDKLNGSNANNLFRGNGENDFLNGSGGNDTYQFLGDFGNDKVFDSAGFDVLQIGANLDNVWFERLGRRGDELKVSVNDGTNVGSISIGRHFTPYSAAGFDYKVEEVHFGFNGIDFEEELTIYSGGQSILDHNNNSYDIVVSKNGEDIINLQADTSQGQNIYLNPNERATTVKLASRESDPSGMWMEFIGLELDYGSHKDHLKISIDNSQVAGSYDTEDVGALHSLLSKNSITVDTTSDFGIDIIQSGDAYQFKDTVSDTLLFALEVNENIVI